MDQVKLLVLRVIADRIEYHFSSTLTTASAISPCACQLISGGSVDYGFTDHRPGRTVLKRLLQEAETADRPLMERYRKKDVHDELIKLLEAEAKDYRAVYRTFADNFLNVSADFGRFLYMCARARKAKRIVEVGTSFGISTIHLACALRDGGGGHMIGTELEPTKAKRAEKTWLPRAWPTSWRSAWATLSKR